MKLTEIFAGIFSSWDTVSVFSATFLTALCILYWFSKPKSSIPSPWFTVPFLGILPLLDRKRPYKTLREWSKKYGDIMQVPMGSVNVVVLNSPELVRKAFADLGDATSSRPEFRKIVQKYDDVEDLPKGGVVLNEGESWKQNRRFTMSSLRDFGVGKSSLEGKIKEEIEVILEMIDHHKGRPFDIGSLIEIGVANIICSIVFGKRFDIDDKEFTDLLHTMQESIKTFMLTVVLAYIPFLQYFQPFRGAIQDTIVYSEKLKAYWRKQTNYHKDRHISEDHPRDFIEAYLVQIQKERKINPNSKINEKELEYVIGDLFGAGSDTTNTTLRWAVLYLASFPDQQEMIHAQIAEEVGRERQPTMADKDRLTLLEAATMEVSRMASIVPLGLMHQTTAPVNLDGHVIPPDTTVTANLWAIHHDARWWSDPDTFDVTRFLDGRGKVLRPDAYMPFSVGKRMCLGKSLAEMELFLFFACLCQRYRFEFAEGGRPPALEGENSIVLAPPPYTIRAILRQ